MSVGEEGVPLAVSGDAIRHREFATVRRGYDPNQVRAYLVSLANHVEALERALGEARARLAEPVAAPPPSEIDPYEELSRRFAGVLATADSEAEHIVEQARDEAERIKSEAQTQAEEVRVRSSHSLVAAEQESDRMLASLSERREAMLRQLHDMQARLLAVADDLEVAIRPSDEPPNAPLPPVVTSPPSPAPTEPPVPAAPVPEPAAEQEPGATARLEDRWVSRAPAPPAREAGLAGLFDDQADDVDLPDLSGIDLELDDEPEDDS